MNEKSAPIFFPVSRFKLFSMSTATFGLYGFYWFYKNWKLIKLRTGNEFIVPRWRACFAIVYSYALFKEIKKVAIKYNISNNFNPILMSITWGGMILCIKLPRPYYFIYILSVLILFPVQKTVNKLNYEIAPKHNCNNQFSTWNVVIIVVGIMIYAFSFIY